MADGALKMVAVLWPTRADRNIIAVGTPVAPLFGVNGEGRGFDILTIDIHELEDGVIVRTYRVEDSAGAIQQLSGR